MASPQLLFCEEDDEETEVFFGKVSERELCRMDKCNRRTVPYKPDFRKDRNLMRYTMDQLQFLSLERAGGDDVRKCGSEGTDSCGSQSPLGSSCSSQGQSPLGTECGSDLPLMLKEPLNGWIKKANGNIQDNIATSPKSDILGPSDDHDSRSCDLHSDKRLPSHSCHFPAVTPHKDDTTDKNGPPAATPGVESAVGNTNSSNSEETQAFIPNRPILSSPSAFASHSPLMNAAGVLGQLPPSPRPILGDLNGPWESDVTYHNVFPESSPASSHSRMLPQGVAVHPTSGTQEVPSMATPGENAMRDSEYLSPIPSLALEDMNAVENGVVPSFMTSMENMLGTNRMDLNESDLNDSFTQCHLVPDVDISPDPDTPTSENRRVSLLKGRSGVTFTEKQFSPTLTVKASPPRDLAPENDADHQVSPLPVRNLFLDLSSCAALSEAEQRQVPQSPECLSEVTFSMTVDPHTNSPRRSRVKRLSPVRSPKVAPNDSRPSSSVFDRLYGRTRTPHSADRGSGPIRPSSAKLSPVVKKGEGMRRAHSASKLSNTKTSVASQPACAPPAARRGPTFSGLDASKDKKPKSSATPQTNKQPRHARTSANTPGIANRNSSAHDAKGIVKGNVTPRNAKNKGASTPTHKVDSHWHSSPGTAQVFRKGTPRFTSGYKALARGPVPKLNLDCCSTGATDIRRLDSSILKLEQEMEQAHQDKVKVTKSKCRQTPGDGPSPRPPARSPALPRTSPKLPKVRFNNKQALSLSEPELDAITLVHTLCNSQQVAKLVKKARATNVVKQVFTPKPASKLQWSEKLVDVLEYSNDEQEGGQLRPVSRKPILTIRCPGHHFPYNDQPPSPIVVTKGTKKFTGFGKDLNIT